MLETNKEVEHFIKEMGVKQNRRKVLEIKISLLK
jgi:hypothetical protein